MTPWWKRCSVRLYSYLVTPCNLHGWLHGGNDVRFVSIPIWLHRVTYTVDSIVETMFGSSLLLFGYTVYLTRLTPKWKWCSVRLYSYLVIPCKLQGWLHGGNDVRFVSTPIWLHRVTYTVDSMLETMFGSSLFLFGYTV